ncbi:MAG: hypothetical protein BHW02_05365 [Clostridium sp. 28_12]|nr:MAG: hypothetical protein BHW02_05365 [Clostridium sp. 28_12]
MKEYNVNLTNQFLEELEKILYFFPNSYLYKKKLYYDIRNTVSTLSIFPERYMKLKNDKKNIRKLIVNKFIIIYKVDNINEKVYILHIFSEKQDYYNLL